MNLRITIKEIPEMQLAGITSLGFQNVASSYERLLRWAAPMGLLNHPETKMVTVYHDSARTTAHDQVRISACMLLKEPVKVADEVELLALKPGKCIVAPMVIGLNEFENAWKDLYRWMGEHGHRPSQEKPFEIYHNNYQEHPQKMCIVDLCIPIE